MSKKVNIDVDSIEIVASYFGSISRIKDPHFQISVINSDHTLNIGKWSEMCRRAAHNGASAIREMCYWLENHYDYHFAPYLMEGGKYRLDHFNPQYFKTLRTMAEIANLYNLKFYFSLYDACGLKRQVRNFNPWYSNHNRVSHFTQARAQRFRLLWVEKVFETLDCLNVGYELCNEPPTGSADMLHATFQHLQRKRVPYCEIIMGAEWDKATYRKFRKRVIKEMGEKEWNIIKHHSFSTIHNVSRETFEKLSLQEGHTRRFFISADGTHPKRSRAWWQTELKDFFKKVPTAAHKNKYAFEAMHKNRDDDFDSVLGIVHAIQRRTGKYPENYRKFPECIPFTPEPGERVCPGCEEKFRLNAIRKFQARFPGIWERTVGEVMLGMMKTAFVN